MNVISEVDFKSLFDQYYVPLCRFAYTLTEDTTASEELVQDMFVYLWENREILVFSSSPKSYLFSSIRNRSLNYLRDRKKFIPFTSELASSLYDDLDVESEELSRLIEEAVSSLPPKCREIFRMSREENLSYKEISERKNISTKTIETQIRIALKRLRVYLLSKYMIFILFLGVFTPLIVLFIETIKK